MTPTREAWYAALEERHGRELQEKISAARVAVCGLGGLGSNIAILLARAGVRRAGACKTEGRAAPVATGAVGQPGRRPRRGPGGGSWGWDQPFTAPPVRPSMK